MDQQTITFVSWVLLALYMIALMVWSTMAISRIDRQESEDRGWQAGHAEGRRTASPARGEHGRWKKRT